MSCTPCSPAAPGCPRFPARPEPSAPPFPEPVTQSTSNITHATRVNVYPSSSLLHREYGEAPRGAPCYFSFDPFGLRLAIRSRDNSSHPCPLRERYDTAPRGAGNTHSHHFAGPSPSRGANTRHVVSSACRCHESRFRSAIAPASGEQRPGLPARPGQRGRRDLRALPGKPRHQGIHAPARGEPLRQQHRDEPVAEQALPDRLRRSRRRHRRRDPAAARPLIPLAAVRGPPGRSPASPAAPRTSDPPAA